MNVSFRGVTLKIWLTKSATQFFKGHVNFLVEQVTFPVHLCNGQRCRKVICQLHNEKQICPGLKADEIQIPHGKHHKVFSLVKRHQNTLNSGKYEVIWKCQGEKKGVHLPWTSKIWQLLVWRASSNSNCFCACSNIVISYLGPKITVIITHQRTWWICYGLSFVSSFDSPWHKWVWIIDPDADYPKKHTLKV